MTKITKTQLKKMIQEAIKEQTSYDASYDAGLKDLKALLDAFLKQHPMPHGDIETLFYELYDSVHRALKRRSREVES